MRLRVMETGDAPVIARFNSFPPAMQSYLERSYHAPFPPENVLLLVQDVSCLCGDAHEERLGVIHVFDAGLPWTVLDGWYIRPEYRSLPTMNTFVRLILERLRERGISLLTTACPPRIARALQRFHAFSNLGGEPLAFLGKVLV